MRVRVLVEGILEARNTPGADTEWKVCRVKRGGGAVGLVWWGALRREYLYEPVDGWLVATVYGARVLHAIANFLEELTTERRKRTWGRKRKKGGRR